MKEIQKNEKKRTYAIIWAHIVIVVVGESMVTELW